MEASTSDVLATLSYGGKVVNLRVGCYLVGNASSVECSHDVPLDNPSVDVKHAAFDISQTGIKLMDLFSQHGTYVEGRKVRKFEAVELQKTAKLQFGSFVCQFQSHHESDSGFLGISNSSIRDTSVIPNTPTSSEKNYKSSSSCQHTQNVSGKSMTSTPTSLAAKFLSPSKAAQGNEESFHVQATQANQTGDENIFGNIADSSMRRNGSFFEEDDDFFIPATQDMFNRVENESNSCVLLQMNTQDFNAGTEEASNDSDNIIANLSLDSIHIPYIDHAIKKIDKVNLEEEHNVQPVENGIAVVGGDDDCDTDCEEELSILKWNDSSKSHNTNVEISKSASVTPDFDFLDIKEGEECPIQVFDEKTEKLNENLASKVDEENESQADNDELIQLEATQAFVLPNISTVDSTEHLQETQIFVSNAASSSSNHSFAVPSIKQFDQAKTNSAKKTNIVKRTAEEDFDATQQFNLANLSTAKINSTKQTNIAERTDEDLEATQQFNLSSFSTAKINSTTQTNTFKRTEKEFEATQQFKLPNLSTAKINSTKQTNIVERMDEGLEATQQFNLENFSTAKINSTMQTNTVKRTEKELEATQQFKLANLSTDENADFLEPTQAFVLPKSIPRRLSKSPILLESDDEENNSQFCIRDTLVIGEEAQLKTERESPKKSKQNKHVNKLFGSSDEEEDDVRLQETPTAVNNSKVNVQPTPQFAFFKLPDVHKINEADEIFQMAAKTFKRTKTILEESSDEDEENNPLKLIDRVLNESAKSKEPSNSRKKSEKDEKVVQSKRITRKASTSSVVSKKEKISDEEKKPAGKSKKVLTKSTKVDDDEIKPSTAVRTRRKDAASSKIIEDKESSKSLLKTSLVETKPVTRTSSRVRTVPGYLADSFIMNGSELTKNSLSKDQQKKQSRQHHQHRNDNVDNNVKVSSADETVVKPELNGRVTRKRDHTGGRDEPGGSKKRSKENDPTVHHLATPMRKTSRQKKQRIIFTKMDSKPYEKVIEQVGACLVDNPADCSVLITDKIYRTWKFLAAMAKGTPIVSIKWLQDAAACKNSELKFDDYLIHDSNAERRFKFTLRKSLERARKTPLFKGFTFHCTRNTKPIPMEIYNIVECAGGTVVRKIAENFKKPENFYVVSDKADAKSWSHLKDSIRSLSIISTEGILISVIQQRINFETYLLS